MDAAELKRRNREGIITGCIVDGPLSYDVAMSAEAAKAKHVESLVSGDPICFCIPISMWEIFAGRLLYIQEKQICSDNDRSKSAGN